MKKTLLGILSLLFVVFSFSVWASAEPPVMHEQLVYSLTSFNGASFSKSFCPANEETIYFIADQENVISPRKTIVYYWPITRKYMAGFSTLNEEMAGKFEVLQGGKVISTLAKQTYTLYYPKGYWSEKASVYINDSAREYFQKYKAAVDQFNTRLKQYYESMTQYRENFNRFLEEVKKRREAGDNNPLNAPVPKEPQPPEFVEFYATELTEGFIIKLPVGEFEIRLRADDGTIIEGSERKVVVFASRRQGGTGYEIIPGNRWTKKENCDDPSWVIHAVGKNELYFNPYRQDEYNELYHNKLEDPQNVGSIERWKWIHIDPIDNIKVLLTHQQAILQAVDKEPYFVKQIQGAELGYEIIKYDDDLKQKGYKPTFESYKVILDENLPKTDYAISTVQAENAQPVPQSERTLRLLKKDKSLYLYAIPIFPLIVGVFMLLSRKSRMEK
ncbi:MAG: hypothetical protein NTX88_08725 [Candidatus Atribacteria bacterium]|nr:hypothetical protein [Candidatus Atribacteria bacterium]